MLDCQFHGGHEDFAVGLACGVCFGFLCGLFTGICCRRRRVPDKKDDEVRDASKSGNDAGSAFLNNVIGSMWPQISGLVSKILREEIEPSLQAAVPPALSGIHFSESKCHLGQTPLHFSRVKVRKDERYSAELGAFRCIRLVSDLVLDSDSEIELVAQRLCANMADWLMTSSTPTSPSSSHDDVERSASKMLSSQLSHLASSLRIPDLSGILDVDLKIGVSHVKVRGRIVIELYHLVPKSPLVSGMRIYFANLPAIDLTMTGNLSNVMNADFVKTKVVDVVRSNMGSHLVLPQRICIPFCDDVDLIRMQTPKPEGMLRIKVLKIQGVTYQGHWYIDFASGGDIFTSSTQQGRSQDGNFTDASILDLTMHDRHSQWLVVSLYSQAQSLVWGPSRGELLGRCNIPFKGILNEGLDLSSSWWPLGAAGSYESSSPVREENLPECDMPCLQLRAEGRCFTRDRSRAAESFWTLKRGGVGEKDVNSILVFGVYGASGLPEEGNKYWCVASCCGEASMTFEGQSARSCTSEGESARIVGEVRPHASRQSNTRKAVFVNDYVNTVEVDWNHSFTYHLDTPETAKVKLTIFEEVDGVARELGSLHYKVSDVLSQHSLQATRHDIVQLAPDVQLSDDVEPLRCRCILKLWLLGPIEQPCTRAKSDKISL